MATAVADVVPVLQREVNVPGAPLFPDALPGDYFGYVEDGFWEGRLAGVFKGWTIIDGADLTSPESGRFITNDNEDDFAEMDQMFLAIIAGFRMIQRKAFDLAQNMRAHAGPLEYEKQVSATVLRELIKSLERRLNEYEVLYSELVSASAFYYMDGLAQSSYAIYNSLGLETVAY